MNEREYPIEKNSVLWRVIARQRATLFKRITIGSWAICATLVGLLIFVNGSGPRFTSQDTWYVSSFLVMMQLAFFLLLLLLFPQSGDPHNGSFTIDMDEIDPDDNLMERGSWILVGVKLPKPAVADRMADLIRAMEDQARDYETQES